MTATPLVAIHQPNFFPWLGYLNKVARADTFVVLDKARASADLIRYVEQQLPLTRVANEGAYVLFLVSAGEPLVLGFSEP